MGVVRSDHLAVHVSFLGPFSRQRGPTYRPPSIAPFLDDTGGGF